MTFFKAHIGSWLVAANARKHEWLIDYIDFDRGIRAATSLSPAAAC